LANSDRGDRKGATVGGHILPARHGSARPGRIDPGLCRLGAPVESTVKEDHFLYLIKAAISFADKPTALMNNGYYMVYSIV